MRLPDFLIGGAPRSGTTWLYRLLDRHPAIYMAKPVAPEPKFFLVDDVYAKGLEHYAKTWFEAAGSTAIAGEKSTDYLESRTAAERIARDLPAIKLVFILRNPVERAYSNYLWTKMNGLETEDFATALRLEPQRELGLPDRLKFTRPYSYFSRGLYADLLEPYLDRFPREQILVLRFEDIIEAPATLATSLQAFVGAEPRPQDVSDLGVVNPADRGDAELAAGIRQELASKYAEANHRLGNLLGPGFPLWP